MECVEELLRRAQEALKSTKVQSGIEAKGAADLQAVKRGIDEPTPLMKKVIQRSDLVSSALSSGGLVATEVRNKFVELAQDNAPVLRQCRREDMASHTTKIPLITFSSPILKPPPAEGSALSSGSRAAPTLSEVTLASFEVHGVVKITYQFLKDNVEKANFNNVLLSQMAKRIGLDIENLGLNGDTASGDPFLALGNGWLKRVTSNIVNASSADYSATLMDQAMASVPLRYRTQAAQMGQKHKFFAEDHATQKWGSVVAGRQTAVGDKYAMEGGVPPWRGYMIEPVANLPVTAGSPNTAPALFTPTQNLILGIYQDLVVIPWDYPPELSMYMIVNMRLAFNLEQELAACKITNVKAAL